MPTERMTPRERILAAINFQQPDRVPRFNVICDNPLYKLGQEGLKLLKEFPSDGGPAPETAPAPDPRFVQPDSSWHRIWTDEWGCTWDENHYGLEGIITRPPLEDWASYRDYQLPPPRPWDPEHPDVRKAREENCESGKWFILCD